jgi:flagellar protein FliS
VTWKDSYLENRVLSADPLELIRLLYGHAIDSIQSARRSFAAGEIAARSKAICAAIAAVTELELSLDHTKGDTISRNLAALYQYVRQRLTQANLQQKPELLAEAESLLATLAEAWRPAAGKSEGVPRHEPMPSMFVCQEPTGATAGLWNA